MGKRSTTYSWVDISKGIAISLMVIGHSSLPSVASRWIFSFHMPFFFFISALFTNWDKDSFSQFCVRKSKPLLIPFVIYSIINMLLLPIALDEPFVDYASEILRNGWGGIALWFVPVFFLSLLICKLTPQRVIFVVGLIMLTIGSLLSEFNILLPWTLSSVPFGTAIMLFTRYFKDEIRLCIKNLSNSGWWLVIVAGLGVSLFISHYFRLDMACNNTTPTIPLIAGIIGGVFFCVGIANLLNNWRFTRNILTHIGRNTYEIMALSQVTILSTSMFIPHMPAVRYAIMILVLVAAVYIREVIEGKYSRVEAI